MATREQKIAEVVDALEEHRKERGPDEFMYKVYAMFIDALRKAEPQPNDGKLKIMLDVERWL